MLTLTLSIKICLSICLNSGNKYKLAHVQVHSNPANGKTLSNKFGHSWLWTGSNMAHLFKNKLWITVKYRSAYPQNYERHNKISTKTQLLILIPRYLNKLLFIMNCSNPCFSKKIYPHNLMNSDPNPSESRFWYLIVSSKEGKISN